MVAEEIKPLTGEEKIISLYKKAFPLVAAFIKKMGGSFDEAKDIFQDALVIYFEKEIAGKLLVEQNSAAYVAGIVRHLWYKKYNKTKRDLPLNENTETILVKEEPKVSEKILQYVERSGKKCLELLNAFYYEKLNMKEVAQRFGFSGERSAAAQKYKCLEKVRNSIKEQSLSRDDFYE